MSQVSITAVLAFALISSADLRGATGNEEGTPVELRSEFSGNQSVVHFKVGTLRANSTYQFRAFLENEGKSPFKPQKVISSCSCAAATLSEAVVDPDGTLDLVLKIASPNTKGGFKRQVTIIDENQQRIDVLLEGDVQMPFSLKAEEFVLSDSDQDFVVELTSNAGEMDRKKFSVHPVSPGLKVISVQWDTSHCKINFAVDGTLPDTIATVVVRGVALDGSTHEQQVGLRIREAQRIQLKPRVLRLKKEGEQLVCRVFLYGDPQELESLELKSLQIDYSNSDGSFYAAEAEARVSAPITFLDSEILEYGMAATLATTRVTLGSRHVVRVSLKPGEWLDDQYVVLFEE